MPIQTRTTFGSALRRARSHAGLSQEDLGQQTGYSHTFISRLENGARSPSRKTVLSFAAAMGCTDMERDELLMAAHMFPVNRAAALQEEPVLAEAYEVLSNDSVSAEAQDRLRSEIFLATQQAGRRLNGKVVA